MVRVTGDQREQRGEVYAVLSPHSGGAFTTWNTVADFDEADRHAANIGGLVVALPICADHRPRSTT